MEAHKQAVRIGEILLQCGFVTEPQLEEALRLGAERHLRLGESLVALGIIDRNRLAWALGLQFDLSLVDVQPEMVDWELLDGLPLDRLAELRLLPLSRLGGTVTAVIADPTTPDLFNALADLFPLETVTVQLGTEEGIHSVLLEAMRRRREATAATGSGGLQELLAPLDSGAVRRVLLVREGEADTVRVLHDGREVGEESAEVLEALAERFAPVTWKRSQAFVGLRPGYAALGRGPVRLLHLPCLTGSLTALATVGVLDAEDPPRSSTPPTVSHPDGPLATAICLHEAAHLVREEGGFALAIGHCSWTVAVSGVMQVEADGGFGARRGLAHLALHAVAPRILVLDECYGTAFTLPADVRTEILRVEEDESAPESSVAALRARVRSILRGGQPS